MAHPLPNWHGMQKNWQNAIGAGGLHLHNPPGGEDIHIPPHSEASVGFIHLYPNMKHDIMFGDRLWFAYHGRTTGGKPRVHVYSQYFTNRNFGAPNTLRRSNTAAIGYMDYQLYNSLYTHRAQWDRAGPRHGQHYQRRMNMKVIERNWIQGWQDDIDDLHVPVVVYWN